MQKYPALLLFILLSGIGFAQKNDLNITNNDIRIPSLGISFFLNDYTTPQRIRTRNLSAVLRDNQFANIREMAPGIAVSYFKGIKKYIDFTATLAGSFVTVPLADQNNMNAGDNFLIEVDASANLKLFSDNYWFSPYLIAGIGASKYEKLYGAFIPLGCGFKINFFNEAALFFSSQYRVPFSTDKNNYHFMNSIGIAGIIGKKKETLVKAVALPQQTLDTDKDGIPDDQDKCPAVAGVARYDGCPVPDTDHDGINDGEDKCPAVAGIARYNGCPIPDTDNDGINDEEDRCKNVPGVARYQGCPVPDSDNDGINDEEDKCPQLPGTRENNGCPEIKQEVQQRVEYAARNVYFNTDSYTLQSRSYKPLNNVVALLKDDPNLKLRIEGHTDNAGADDYNQTLSENRANSVKEYLLSKGIEESRLQAQGFGENQPIADNNMAAGRAQYRRVVMTLSYE